MAPTPAQTASTIRRNVGQKQILKLSQSVGHFRRWEVPIVSGCSCGRGKRCVAGWDRTEEKVACLQYGVLACNRLRQRRSGGDGDSGVDVCASLSILAPRLPHGTDPEFGVDIDSACMSCHSYRTVKGATRVPT